LNFAKGIAGEFTVDIRGGSFKSQHIVLDADVLALRESKEQEKTDEKVKVVRNAIDEYKKRKVAYNEVIEVVKDERNSNVSHIKAIVHLKK